MTKAILEERVRESEGVHAHTGEGEGEGKRMGE